MQLMASGVGFPWVEEAARLLADDWGVQADLWSVTSWNELARDGAAAEQWNLLNPGEERRTAYVSDKLAGVQGPVVAVSDYMRAVPLQIARWVPADYRVLGADGFGFADTRPAARRFFHIDASQRRRPGPPGPGRRRVDFPVEKVVEAAQRYQHRRPDRDQGRQAGGRRRLSRLTRRRSRPEETPSGRLRASCGRLRPARRLARLGPRRRTSGPSASSSRQRSRS